jgi:hypothetical protein
MMGIVSRLIFLLEMEKGKRKSRFSKSDQDLSGVDIV